MKWFVLALATVGTLGVVSPVHADPITYTETGTGTGALDGTAFWNALVTVTVTGDTSNVMNSGPAFFYNTGSGTVTVAGIGTDTFTDPLQVYAEVEAGFPAYAGILDNQGGPSLTGNAVLEAVNVLSGLTNYQLTTPIGPVTGYGEASEAGYSTTLGSFDLATSYTDPGASIVNPYYYITGDVTFTATLGSPAGDPAPVPEPGSVFLLGSGLVFVAKRVRQGAWGMASQFLA
jgi:hypothetical protein